ncbi:methyl-accepting chemotaxis protein [Calidifontimicrobium sp. SYSU G02091]|uniref:methyl-accepting chemotaxis protein n=1 Tax=Calidifontimicrobium sp. SYSU G02091 TaxID=2926421 RepID=UPI0023513BA0|nr:methyl-accepting chemotaxis protein [Calidifontimicrobium sp. SYSU G02091]
MQLLDNLSLRNKLLLAPAVCLVLLVLSAAGEMWGFAQQRAALDSIHAQRLPSYTFVAALESGIRDLNGLINRSIGYSSMGFNAKEIDAIDQALAETSARLSKALADRAAAVTSDDEREVVKALAAGFAKYDQAIKDTLDMKSTGAAMAATFLTTAQGEYDRLLKQISEVTATRMAAIDADVASARASAATAQTTIAVAALVALGAGIGLSVLLARGLLRRMHAASAAVARLADGDLTQPLQAHGRDEVGRLVHDVESVRQRLAQAIHAVQQASDSVKVAAGEIASGNADLSARTETQASSLQQTASSMEQLTATVKTNADTARAASQLATAARDVATRGGDVVGQVVATMDEISASSRRIADIIGTIDGIAFQTNILALNAAVEAARAGEQGRGFAVVAGEVRSLAQRSAQAAKEIKSLIGASVEKVDTGAKLVGDAGATMQDIVQQVKRVSDLIAEISAASAEQTSGIGQIGDAVHQLDQATQQNAALVEQSAAAAESLRQQAEQLVAAVSVFRVAHTRA